MVLVLLQWLSSKVWQSELNRTWQHLVCHHICNFIYCIWAAKCIVDCSLPLRFSNNSVCTSNVTLCHINQQFISFPHIILITSGERYKLWSYSSCSFIHFPITFRCKSLNTLNSTIPIFSLQNFLKVTYQVSYTSIYKKILGKHAHFCISMSRFQRAKQNNMKFTPNSFHLHFLILQSSLLTTPLKYLSSSPTLSKCATLNQLVLGYDFFLQINWSNVAIQSLWLYRPNFRLPSSTALYFYSPYVVTRYYSITTTEMKLLCASLIQLFFVAVSIQG